MSKYRRRYPQPSDQVEYAIDQHRRAIDIVRKRHLERRRLARLLWNVEDEATINAIVDGPEEWAIACADLEAAEASRHQAALMLTRVRPDTLGGVIILFTPLPFWTTNAQLGSHPPSALASPATPSPPSKNAAPKFAPTADQPQAFPPQRGW